jgi:hypothetical protein
MAAGFHAGRSGYPVKLFVLYDGAAAVSWATYGGLVGHVGGTAITQSAWRLFAIAAVAAAVFGTAGWILALSGGRTAVEDELSEELAEIEAVEEAETITATRAASADGPPPRSTPTTTGRS